MNDDPSTARVEVFVEPFHENAPGPHVAAAVEALNGGGLTVDMGPFATEADGELQASIDAVATMLRASFAAGADAIQVRIERRPPAS